MGRSCLPVSAIGGRSSPFRGNAHVTPKYCCVFSANQGVLVFQYVETRASHALNSIINIPEGLLEDFVATPVFACGACGVGFEPEPPGERLSPDARCPECTANALREESRVISRGDAAATAGHLRSLRSASTHLLAVVNDVLDFSKLEAGKMTFHFQQVAISTAYDDNREVAAAHGADWVSKPWSSAELTDRVAAILHRSGREQRA